SVHEPIALAPGPVPETFLEEQKNAVVRQIGGRWWELFNDTVLNGLMEEALAHNLDLARAYARLDQLAAAYHIVDSQRRPFLNLGGTASRDKQHSSMGDTLGNTYRLSVNAGYEVDLWQKLKNQSEAAWLVTLSARENIKTLYITLTAQLADLYFIAVEQRSQLQLLEAIIASYEDTVERVGSRYHSGQASALAVYQSRQELAVARQRRPIFERTLARTEHAIAVLLGRLPEKSVSGSLTSLPDVGTIFSAGLPADLLQRRPDIEGAFLQVKAQDVRLAAAIADRFPSLSLSGAFGVSWFDFGSTTSGSFWSLLAGAGQPIFDSGRRKAEEERNRAALRETVANYRQTVLTAFQEVEDGLSDNRTTEERLALLKEQESVSSANVRVARDGYFHGINDYLPVLIAERQYFDVQIQVIAAKRQLVSDRITLVRALGGNWMEEYISENEAVDMNERQEKENL
ncbi:MAG: efflux transporter outer membrane subunit, partial [Desulfobulbales bacterium]|nr:efflux transporter outer membrane subunit [Desulfobulbales bacterium]